MDKNPNISSDCDVDLLAMILRHVERIDQRISSFEHKGQIIWVKKQERHTLRMRLQKGDAHSAFQAELDAYQQLKTADVPVPKVLAYGDSFIATADSGLSLHNMLLGEMEPQPIRIVAFRMAGEQLALMHKQQLSHGRPSIKDICWQDGHITFLDFERFSEKRHTAKGHMQDLVMMVFSAYSVSGRDCPEIDAMIKAYRENDPAGIWEMAAKWCAKKGWVDLVTKPIQWRGAGKAREFKAIPVTLKAFGKT